MSGLEILSTLNILIKLRLEIKTRLDSLNQATEDLQLLTTNLILLLKVFENPVDEDIVKILVPEFANILDVLQSITHSCTKCAKALDIDLAGTTIATKKIEAHGKRFIKRIWAFNKIPGLLAEIQPKAGRLQQVYSTVSAAILHDIGMHKDGRVGRKLLNPPPSSNYP